MKAPGTASGNRTAYCRSIHGAGLTFPLVLMSFVVGVLIGLTSMGGAALMAPFLILVFGVRPVTAVGTDLVYGAVTGGLLGASLVILLSRFTHEAEHYVQKAIATLLVIVAITLLARMVKPFRAATPSAKRWRLF